MSNFDEIQIDKINLGEQNVRKIDVDLEIDELAKSIEEHGLLQPIIVRATEGGFELIVGQRRLSAMIRLKKSTVPAMIIDISDQNTMLMVSLIENVQRVDIDERDRAAAVVKLVEANNQDYKVVGKMLGKSEATIRTWAGYHGVPDRIKELKEKGFLNQKEAVRLTGMLGPVKAVPVAEELAKFPKKERRKVLHGLSSFTALEPEEVLSWAKREVKEKPLTIKFMSSIMIGLEKAALARGETPVQTVHSIVREWLTQRHYIDKNV